MLLKASPLISELSLYDIVGTEGVGADLSHIDSSPKVNPTGSLYCNFCESAQASDSYSAPSLGHCKALLNPSVDCVQVSSFTGAEKLPEALYGSSLVVIPAGIPRKPGMTRDDLFNINAGDSTTNAM